MKNRIIWIFTFLGLSGALLIRTGTAQIVNNPGVRVIYLGDDSVKQENIRLDPRTFHLVITEKTGMIQPYKGGFRLNLDSFPNLLTLELLNIQSTVFTISGSKKSRVRELIVGSSPSFDLKRGIDLLSRVALIEHLKLEGISDPELPSNFKRLRTLSKLTIENCEIVNMKNLLDATQKIKGLEALCVTGNFEVHFPLRYSTSRYVRHLDFSENYLSDFPTWIIDPEGVDLLDISGNDIDLSDFLYAFRKLKTDTLITDIREADDTLLVKEMLPETYACYVFDTLIYRGQGQVFTGMLPGGNGVISERFKSTYRSFSPPLRNVEVPFYLFRAEAETGQVWRTGNGTSITIPGGVLVNASGEEITGSYQLYYRDLTDPVSIFTSGIPMNCDSGGVTHIFESSGMFEMYAVQDSQFLQLKPGNSIRIELPTPSTDIDYDLYSFDDENGVWVAQEGDVNAVTVEERPKIYSEAYRFLRILDVFKFDTSSFATRYELPQYARTRRLRDYFWGIKKDLYPYLKIKKIRTPRDRRGQVLFKFPYVYSKSKRKYILSTSAYKELSVYCPYDWQYVGGLTKAEFLKTFSRSKKWTDVRVEMNDAGNIHTIILKNPHEEAELEAVLLMRKPSDEEKRAQITGKLDKQYNKSLTRSEASHNRTIAKRKARELRKDWKFIRRLMSPEELKMSQSEWIIYAQKAFEMLPKIDSIYMTMNGVVTRTLQVDGFGLWNCDRIRKLPATQVWAEVVDTDNKKIFPKTSYLINRSDLSVISMPSKDDKVQYLLMEGIIMAMCFIDQQGDLYVAHYSEFSDPKTIASTRSIRAVKLETQSSATLHELIGF